MMYNISENLTSDMLQFDLNQIYNVQENQGVDDNNYIAEDFINVKDENNDEILDILKNTANVKKANKYKVKAHFGRFKNMLNIETLIKTLQPNNLAVSFNDKFIRPKNRFLYYRTVMQNYVKPIRIADSEEIYLSYLNNNMLRIEAKELYKRSLNGLASTFVSMLNRTFDYTIVSVTHCFKNTFTCISRGKRRSKSNKIIKMLAKLSSGLIGFHGPKKSTVFARKGVIKESGKLLSGFMTSLLEVIFTSKVSRWNRKSVRDLCSNLCYVTNITISYSRPHGYRKYKNKQRK